MNERLVDALTRAYINGGTPPDQARRSAESFLQHPENLLRLSGALSALALSVGVHNLEDRRS